MAQITYNLTDEQIKKIARLCTQEQGTLPGIRAEASLAANLLETNKTYARKYGADVYSFMRSSGWFAKAAYWMDFGSASTSAIEAVRDVLVNGNRFFPGNFIDEHDCFSDIVSAKNFGETINRRDRSAYIQDVTVVKNRFGSTYTFYCFPDEYTDPFGYTSQERRAAADVPKEEPKDYVLVEVEE